MCGSMNPGATMSPRASIVRFAWTFARAGIADEGDPVPRDRHVRAACRRAGSVDDSAVSNEEVGRRTLSSERAPCRDERSEAHQGDRDSVAHPASHRARWDEGSWSSRKVASVPRDEASVSWTLRTLYGRRDIKLRVRVPITRLKATRPRCRLSYSEIPLSRGAATCKPRPQPPCSFHLLSPPISGSIPEPRSPRVNPDRGSPGSNDPAARRCFSNPARSGPHRAVDPSSTKQSASAGCMPSGCRFPRCSSITSGRDTSTCSSPRSQERTRRCLARPNSMARSSRRSLPDFARCTQRTSARARSTSRAAFA